MTSTTPRVMDLYIYDADGNFLGRIEVKSGGSRYSGTPQAAKDAELQSKGEGPARVIRTRSGPPSADPNEPVFVEAGFEGTPPWEMSTVELEAAEAELGIEGGLIIGGGGGGNPLRR